MLNFASVAASLHELTKKSKAYQWRKSQEKAFQTLKDLLCAAPVLAYPAPGEKFILNSDAGCSCIFPGGQWYGESRRLL